VFTTSETIPADASVRVTFLLPTTGDDRRQAAERVIQDLWHRFPEGGTVVSLPGSAAVAWGWWTNRRARRPERRVVRDTHVVVWIDVPVPARDDRNSVMQAACRKVVSAFRKHYVGETAESVIYLSASDTLSLSCPGATK